MPVVTPAAFAISTIRTRVRPRSAIARQAARAMSRLATAESTRFGIEPPGPGVERAARADVVFREHRLDRHDAFVPDRFEVAHAAPARLPGGFFDETVVGLGRQVRGLKMAQGSSIQGPSCS